MSDQQGLQHTDDGGKVKKSRRRAKQSCTQCARRRQKCSGGSPCIQCTGRNVAHLCKSANAPDAPTGTTSTPLPTSNVESINAVINSRSEPIIVEEADDSDVPVALKGTKLNLKENGQIIKELSQRIQTLESRVHNPLAISKGIDQVYLDNAYGALPTSGNESASTTTASLLKGYEYLDPSQPSTTSMKDTIVYRVSSSKSASISPASTLSLSQAPHPPNPPPPRRISQATHLESAGAELPSLPEIDSQKRLSTFSLGHRGHFFGAGTVLQTLNFIRSPTSPLRIPHCGSTESTSITPLIKSTLVKSLAPSPQLDSLLYYIPSTPTASLLVDAFFKEKNWRYGIPEKWFQGTCTHMWNYKQSPEMHQGLDVNLHWLTLLFAIFACVSKTGESPEMHDSDTYFSCAWKARSLGEENCLNRTGTLSMGSPLEGSVLGCLAVPILCDYLSERGRLSEAWVLIGTGIREAEGLGLHKDPDSNVWLAISEEEKIIRRRGWWNLYIWDRLYAPVLGRPPTMHGRYANVLFPRIADVVNSKERRNSLNHGQGILIQLASLISESWDKCMSIASPDHVLLSEMIEKFKAWETTLSSELRPGTTPEQDLIAFAGVPPSDIQNYIRQRYMITTWYYLIRVKLYIMALTGQFSPSPSPAQASPVQLGLDEIYAEPCLQLILDMIKFQCDSYDRMKSKSGDRWPGSNWYFEGCYTLFEGAVSLICVLTKFPTKFFIPVGADVMEELKKGFKVDYTEVTRLLRRTLDIFVEVVKIERADTDGDGKRSEMAEGAFEDLQGLIKGHWWQLNPAQTRVGLTSGRSADEIPPMASLTSDGGARPAMNMPAEHLSMPSHEAQSMTTRSGRYGIPNFGVPINEFTNPSVSPYSGQVHSRTASIDQQMMMQGGNRIPPTTPQNTGLHNQSLNEQIPRQQYQNNAYDNLVNTFTYPPSVPQNQQHNHIVTGYPPPDPGSGPYFQNSISTNSGISGAGGYDQTNYFPPYTNTSQPPQPQVQPAKVVFVPLSKQGQGYTQQRQSISMQGSQTMSHPQHGAQQLYSFPTIPYPTPSTPSYSSTSPFQDNTTKGLKMIHYNHTAPNSSLSSSSSLGPGSGTFAYSPVSGDEDSMRSPFNHYGQ